MDRFRKSRVRSRGVGPNDPLVGFSRPTDSAGSVGTRVKKTIKNHASYFRTNRILSRKLFTHPCYIGDMTAQTDRQKLPDALVETPDDPDVSTVRSERTHLDQRINDLRPTPSGTIRAETKGEIVDITDRGSYTLVGAYPTSGNGSDAYPQPLFPYRVNREKRPNGMRRMSCSVSSPRRSTYWWSRSSFIPQST